MSEAPSLAEIGAVIGDPIRLLILEELMSGVPLPVGVIAVRVGIAPSTATSHVKRMLNAGLLEVKATGRTRLLSIASPQVASVYEALLRIPHETRSKSLSTHQRQIAMREARSCYDHLAGKLGIGMKNVALNLGWIRSESGTYVINNLLKCEQDLGLVIRLPKGSRSEISQCQDWTEREFHISGKFGAVLLSSLLDANWLSRKSSDRSLRVTQLGHSKFKTLGAIE